LRSGHRDSRRVYLRVLICGTLLLIALAPAAGSHDSRAPRGVDYHPWLPWKRWVSKHWMPYDEARLRELLRVDTPTVYRWLKNDHRTLAELARRRGVAPGLLAKRLLATRREQVKPRVYAFLRRRTQRTLTQGHLAPHMYFHVFHGADLVYPPRRWVGVGARRWRELRYERGWTAVQIARRHGRDPAALRSHAIEALRADAAQGVRRGATSREEAAVMLSRQMRVLDCWLKSPHPKFDPYHPFGDPHGGHGPHGRGSDVGTRNPKPARRCWRALYAEP
jgi:hypothetical protein